MENTVLRPYLGAGATEDGDREFDDVLGLRAVHTVFQPIIALQSGEVVGLEALARGPVGSVLESPRELFAAARRRGKMGELDWVCRAAAYRAVAGAGLPPSISLFVNAEPESLALACPADLTDAISRAEAVLRVFVEVNDRALAEDPAGLVRAVDRARTSGWGVALDDVGASPASLAVLPLVDADVVKLDLRLLQRRSPGEAAAITFNVLRLLESTGVALLVEGIESADDVAWAQALGARYGQGYFLGAPAPLAEEYAMPRRAVPLRKAEKDRHVCSPWAHLESAGSHTMSGAAFDRLAQMAYRSALRPGAEPVILGGLGRRRPGVPLDTSHFPVPTVRPLLWVLFGDGSDEADQPGLHRVALERGDPTALESFVIVLREHDAVAAVARPAPFSSATGATGGDMVEVVVTQDPALIHPLARHLVRRIPADLDGGGLRATWIDAPEDDPSADRPAEPTTDEPARRTGWRKRLSLG
jgi:EAL domain-containing protein (putative c-di-GMP-specific phosphodiesterase class I)